MKREKVIEGVKIALNVVVGFGITLLCGAFAGNLTNSSNVGSIKKACMAIGGTVIGGMLSQQAEKYVNNGVDETVKKIDEIVAAVNAATTTEET